MTADSTARDFWERSRVGWHAVYLGLLAVVAVIAAVDSELSPAGRLRSLVLLAAMAAWYLLLGRRVLGGERHRLALGYLAVAWALWLALVATEPTGYLLLVVLFPQVWAMTATRAGAITVTAFGVLGLVLLQSAEGGWTSAAVAEAATFGVLNIAISSLLGLWITGIIRESERRADLITELERTRADLAAVEHDRGVLAERERLAAEIHDTLAQSFTSILMLAQSAETVLEEDPDAARERLVLLEGTARDGLAEARSLVAALGPVDLETATLADAVDRLVRRVGQERALSVAVHVEGDARTLPPNAEVVLLRATQEAMANIRKHAAARSIDVRLRYLPEAAVLDVRDDGCGFDASDVDGFGLRGMRARVEQVGGTVEVDSAPGRGTSLRICVPVP